GEGQALPESTIYKTGDLARYLADGSIEFLGRSDQQVKLRGFRIELEEIERGLEQHPGVARAVAMVREDTPGARLLVAYLVPAAEASPSSSELRRFLQRTLPDYMIPSAFVVTAAIPLTPNGKTDRRALPAPDSARPSLETAFVAPRSALEQTIGSLWRDVLQLEQVGVNDNFFDLGGHSLLLAALHRRLQDELGVDLPIVKLFQYPTISALAAHLAESLASPTSFSQLQERARQQKAAIARQRRPARPPERS
ncbi:MAG: non-ribosomal peptide synthetase, partial [Chloroflexales bacterium]|nr:non-ribosomal peptide synthetase [Chloroflexales bacterium]